jgi:hypothetical protein
MLTEVDGHCHRCLLIPRHARSRRRRAAASPRIRHTAASHLHRKMIMLHNLLPPRSLPSSTLTTGVTFLNLLRFNVQLIIVLSQTHRSREPLHRNLAQYIQTAFHRCAFESDPSKRCFAQTPFRNLAQHTRMAFHPCAFESDSSTCHSP